MKPSDLQLWGGLECTVNRVRDKYHSQLQRSGHDLRERDLDLFAELGIRTLRYPLLWEQHAGNTPDWSWAGRSMRRLLELKINVIAGLVHHGSGPAYTSLLDNGFAGGLAWHAAAVARRFPEIKFYNPVNEPLTTRNTRSGRRGGSTPGYVTAPVANAKSWGWIASMSFRV